MDELSLKIYKELMKEEYWERTLDRFDLKSLSKSLDIGEIYAFHGSNEMKQAIKQICNGTYKWSVPEKLMLAKSGTTKKRVVYMYSLIDRYLLGVLYRGLSEFYNDKFVDNCFSYKRGVSTNSAIKYIQKMKDNKKMYGLKVDISSYFNSVTRDHINKCLTELFGEDTGIRKTMDNLFNNDIVSYRGQLIEEYKSLIAGCALGSFFANYCLRDIDQYFYDRNIIYARYSDDIIILHESQEKIMEYIDYIKGKLSEYGLSINPKKYTYFDPQEAVEYLGLSLSDRGIDIADNTKKKLKRTIKRWVKAGRKQIEMEDKQFEKVARNLVKRLNWKLYKSYIEDERKFGWAFYVFRYITILDSLTEIDFYLRDRLRYLKTGKNNKANVKALNDGDFRDLGVLSLYDMYILFHTDFDYYCEVVYLV